MASSRMNNLNGFRSQAHFNNTSSYTGTTTNTWDRPTTNTSSASSNDNTSSSKFNNELYIVNHNIIPYKTPSLTLFFALFPTPLLLAYRNAGFHGSMMNHPINSGNDDMFILSPQVDYNGRPPVGGLVTNYNNNNTNNNNNNNGTGPTTSGSSYSVYPPQDQQQQQNRTGNTRMYFTEELLDDAKEVNNNNESNTPTNSSFYGKYYKNVIFI